MHFRPVSARVHPKTVISPGALVLEFIQLEIQYQGSIFPPYQTSGIFSVPYGLYYKKEEENQNEISYNGY